MNVPSAWRGLLALVAMAALEGSVVACGGSSTAPSDDAGQCTPVVAPTTCPSSPPSYKNEIRYIVASSCAGTQCHQAGGAESVKDFTTYQGLAADHITVAFEVEQCPLLMPPPGYAQPTTAQRLALVTWAATCRAPNN